VNEATELMNDLCLDC